MNVAIIGTGAYGMALASVFYNNKCNVKMWTNSEEEKNMLLKNGKSDKVDFTIPKDIRQLLRLSCGNRFYFIVDSKPKYTFGKFCHICYESSSKRYRR